MQAARDFLATRLDLQQYSVSDENTFRRQLDVDTNRLMTALPQQYRFWGVARKAVNIFLRDAFYNFYLRQLFNPLPDESWFEVPLDLRVAKKLRKNPLGSKLPPWCGVKHVTSTDNDQYQATALFIARTTYGISRVHLDTYLWP